MTNIQFAHFRKKKLSHDQIDLRFKQLPKYQLAAENVGFANEQVGDYLKGLLVAWTKSKVHNVNLLGNFNTTGISIHSKNGYYFATQLFAYLENRQTRPVSPQKSQGLFKLIPQIRSKNGQQMHVSIFGMSSDEENENLIQYTLKLMNSFRKKHKVQQLELNRHSCQLEFEHCQNMLMGIEPLSNGNFQERIDKIKEFNCGVPMYAMHDIKGDAVKDIVQMWETLPTFQKTLQIPLTHVGISVLRIGYLHFVSVMLLAND